MLAAVIFGLAWVVSAILVRLIRAWAEHQAILDHPNERSSQSAPTPHGGGIAIVVITLAGSMFWDDAALRDRGRRRAGHRRRQLDRRPSPSPSYAAPRRANRRRASGGHPLYAACVGA